MSQHDELAAQVTGWLRQGLTLEDALGRLRRANHSKVSSVLAVSIACKMELGEAKKTVHDSLAWRDRREADDAFHDALFDAVEKLDDVPSDDTEDAI
jgi:hypothetical protein